MKVRQARWLDEYNFHVNHRRNPQRNFDKIIRAIMDNEERMPTDKTIFSGQYVFKWSL